MTRKHKYPRKHQHPNDWTTDPCDGCAFFPTCGIWGENCPRFPQFAQQVGQPTQHHPDCNCNVCTYGADADKFLHHASEY